MRGGPRNSTINGIWLCVNIAIKNESGATIVPPLRDGSCLYMSQAFHVWLLSCCPYGTHPFVHAPIHAAPTGHTPWSSTDTPPRHFAPSPIRLPYSRLSAR